MTRAARTRLSAREREIQILQAATRVFARSNYRLASIADIALEAGISEPAVYRYFPSKKDLFLRILDGTGKAVLHFWQKLASPEATGIETLQRMGDAYVEGARGHIDELKVQFQALAESDDPDFARVLRQNHEGYVRFIADAIEKGMGDGTIRPDVDPEAMAWLLDSVGFTSTLLRLLGFGHETGERQYHAMMSACLSLLAAPGGSSASVSR